MKVFLVGSKKNVDTALHSAFETFFKDLGNALARQGHNLIVNSGSLNTADPYAVDGVNAYQGKTTVYLIRPDVAALSNPDSPLYPYSDESLTPNISFIKHTAKSSFRSSHLDSIAMADVIVAVGGSNGTTSVIYTADAMDKPVLIVPSFGGASKEAWRDFNFKYTDDIRSLLQVAPTTLIAQVPALVTGIASYKRNQDVKRIGKKLNVCLLIIAMVLAVTGWFAMLNGVLQKYIGNPYMVQIAVIVAANTIGLGLKYFLTLSNQGGILGEVKKPLIEWFASNLLSVAVFFLALFAGTSIAEKEVAKDAFASGTSAFLALSAIGFFCSLFTDKAARKVVSSMG